MHVCMCACVRVCAQDVGNVVGILVCQGGSDVMFATSHVPQQLPAQLGWGVGCELAVRAGPTSGLVPCSSLPRLDHIGLWSESLNLFNELGQRAGKTQQDCLICLFSCWGVSTALAMRLRFQCHCVVTFCSKAS